MNYHKIKPLTGNQTNKFDLKEINNPYKNHKYINVNVKEIINK